MRAIFTPAWGLAFRNQAPHLAREKPRRWSATQQAELAEIVETGPDHAVDGVLWCDMTVGVVLGCRTITVRTNIALSTAPSQKLR